MDDDSSRTGGTSDGHVSSDWSGFDTPSVAIVMTVAAVRNRDPVRMQPLNDVIDVDALDTLLMTATSTVSLSFTYENVDVVVSSDGTVDVVQPSE